VALVDDLKELSADFRRWWQAPTSEEARRGVGSVLTADAERLDFHHETLLVDEHRHLRMVVYFVERASR
jgi:ketosteroid isomerase-like protein